MYFRPRKERILISLDKLNLALICNTVSLLLEQITEEFTECETNSRNFLETKYFTSISRH